MLNSKMWLEGRRAAQEGQPEDSNPYRGADFETWRQGWQTARSEGEGEDPTGVQGQGE